LKKNLKLAPLITLLVVTLLLSQIVAVAASSSELKVEQGDEIDYELKEVTEGMIYENMTGNKAGLEYPQWANNMSVGDQMTFTLGVVSEDTIIKAIESFDPAVNITNTYVYDADNLTASFFYFDAFLWAVFGWDFVPWYYTWFNPFGVPSRINFVPWVLTTDWDAHEDEWMAVLAYEETQGINPAFGGFDGIVNITAEVDDDTSYTTPDDDEVDTVTFTMHAVYNASAGANFENETAYYVEVEYDEETGQCVMQDITLRDLWNEYEIGNYSSIHMLWEYEDSTTKLGPGGLPMLYIALPIIAVVVAVVVYLAYSRK